MSSLARTVFVDHPTPIFTGAIIGLSVASLNPAPSLIPLVSLISTFHLYTRIVVPRSHHIERASLGWLAATVGACVAHAPAAHDALSTGWMSMLLLFGASGISTTFAFSAFFLDYKFSLSNPLARLLVFPAAWATLWALVSTGPVGRLSTWSPVQGIEAYRWMRPYVGPWGIDWVVAAWAVVISQAVGTWAMGAAPEDSEEREAVGPLVSFEGDDHAETNPALSSPSTKPRRSYPVLVLLGALLVLTIPSYLVPNLPIPVQSDNTIPLTVGCVLPAPVTGNSNTPQLADFIAASRTLSASRLLIWPEGAVHFDSETHRNETLAEIQTQVLAQKKGTFIGISFEENIPSGHASGGRHLRRNGFLIMDSDGTIVHEYYKRNLVPVAESFSMRASIDLPTIASLDWPWVKHRKSWVTRSIPVTSSICLDFTSASPFASLHTRPALILAPARTWHLGAGLAMWEQAKARAEELGSTVLWCDGGEGGVSGVAGVGAGAGGIIQVGQGSWETTVAVPWPIVEERTMFAAGGDWMALVLVWSIVGLGAAPELVAVAVAGRAAVMGGPWRLVSGAKAIWGGMLEKRRSLRSTQGEQQSLLG